MENITLRVAEAPQNVAGRGIAVVDPELVNRLDWRAGEVIEITGKKKAYALIWPGQMGDYGKKHNQDRRQPAQRRGRWAR